MSIDISKITINVNKINNDEYKIILKNNKDYTQYENIINQNYYTNDYIIFDELNTLLKYGLSHKDDNYIKYDTNITLINDVIKLELFLKISLPHLKIKNEYFMTELTKINIDKSQKKQYLIEHLKKEILFPEFFKGTDYVSGYIENSWFNLSMGDQRIFFSYNSSSKITETYVKNCLNDDEIKSKLNGVMNDNKTSNDRRLLFDIFVEYLINNNNLKIIYAWKNDNYSHSYSNLNKSTKINFICTKSNVNLKYKLIYHHDFPQYFGKENFKIICNLENESIIEITD